MATYILRRLLQGIVVLFLATFLIYSIILITPGGPQDQVNQLRIESTAGRPVNPLLEGILIRQYGLDKPYPINYLAWLFDPTRTDEWDFDQFMTVTKGIDILGLRGSGILTGDFGKSVRVQGGGSVIGMMGERLGNTLSLTLLATLVAITIALPLGILSAIKQYSKLDYAVTSFSFVGLAMPTFWLGLMLIIFTAIIPKDLHTRNNWDWLPYLPPGGNYYDFTTRDEFLNRVYHMILPVTVLSFVSIAGLSRFVRASMLEVLRQDYVRTAWAKGLSQRVVIVKHALRNALIPVITIVTLGLPGLFSGAIITETVFAYSGMGKLYYEAVLAFDIPLIMGFLLIITTLIILSNILADVLYAVADPRIRFA